jgi:hypothetical protein
MTIIVMILLVGGALVMFGVILAGMTSGYVIPAACPACHDDGDRDMTGLQRTWYRHGQGDVIHCRACHRQFKQHSNGSLDDAQ